MIACDREVRPSDIQHKHSSRPAWRKLLEPPRGFRAACEHLEDGVLFQALKAGGEPRQNYLAVSAVLFLNSMPNYQREDRHGK